MESVMQEFGDILYEVKDRVATITLNRPETFNAISPDMPADIERAFNYASDDDSANVIVLTGAGKGFCGGYDLTTFAEGDNSGIQEMPWDPMIDYKIMGRWTQQFMSIWRCPKPVIARVHGDAVAGGVDEPDPGDGIANDGKLHCRIFFDGPRDPGARSQKRVDHSVDRRASVRLLFWHSGR